MPYHVQISEEDLPVLSAVAGRALMLLSDSDVGNREIDELIRQDPSLTQRVLHVANSPFYAGRHGSKTISHAISRLGLRQLRNVIMMAATGELFNADDPVIQHLWEHAIATAMAAQIVSEQLRLPATEEAFIAGMLHDVGKLIIYRQVPEDYRQLMQETEASGERLHVAEERLFEYFNHVSVGGLTIKKWRMSDMVADAVRYHHVLEQTLPASLDNPMLPSVVSLASVFANNLGHGRQHYAWEKIPKLECARQARMRPELVMPMAEMIRQAVEAQKPCLV